MTVSLTRDGTATITPYMVLGYEFARASGNLRHDIIGAAPEVTLRPLGPRTGTLSFLCLTAADAVALEAFLAANGTFVFADTDVPEAGFSFVLADGGNLSRTLDPDTRKRWIVAVDFLGV